MRRAGQQTDGPVMDAGKTTWTGEGGELWECAILSWVVRKSLSSKVIGEQRPKGSQEIRTESVCVCVCRQGGGWSSVVKGISVEKRWMAYNLRVQEHARLRKEHPRSILRPDLPPDQTGSAKIWLCFHSQGWLSATHPDERLENVDSNLDLQFNYASVSPAAR